LIKYIDPKSLSKKFRRRILRALKEMGVILSIKTYERKIINGKEVVEVSIKAEIPKEVTKVLKKHGIKLSNKEVKAFVSPVIIWDLIREVRDEEIPIGTSIDGNYVVSIPICRICTNDYLNACYLGLVMKDTLWIDTINLSRELEEIGFIEIEGIPLKLFSRGKIEDFARSLAKKTIGERYVTDILDFLLKKEELGADEELPLYSREITSIKDLFKWRTILIDELEKDFSKDNVFIDLVDVPKTVLWMTLLAGVLSDKKLIILSINYLDKEIIDILSMRKEFIVFCRDCLGKFDVKIIKKSDDEYLLQRYGWFEGKRVVMKERFIPLFRAIERVKK